MDEAPTTPPVRVIAPPDPPAYVYAPSDIGPRQTREIALCEKASRFDWMYTGAAFVGVVGSVWVNIKILKQSEEPGIRTIGPASIGLFWGGLLGGGYLSLPKCDPTWAYGTPPEGNVRADWPTATAIALIAMSTAPALDYVFLGPVKTEWTVPERSLRVFTAMGAGLAGSLLPYLLPPKPWAAKVEIDRIRLGATPEGGVVSYTATF